METRYRQVPDHKLQQEAERLRAVIARQSGSDLAFLHIPKTGGHGFESFNRALPRGSAVIRLRHCWSVPDLAAHFPELRLCFLLRDPLLRNISAFNSRLRQGRPTALWGWSVSETAAFAHFRSAGDWLRALISSDEHSMSAAQYARSAISHLTRNYTFYFTNAETARAHAHRYRVIETVERSLEFSRRLAVLQGFPESLADENYHRRHVSNVPTSSVLESFSEEEIAAIRATMADEYAIHDALLEIRAALLTGAETGQPHRNGRGQDG